jgi:hypothetical protein
MPEMSAGQMQETPRLDWGHGIKNIEDSKVRGLVRGLLDRKAGQQELRATLNKLLATIQSADLELLDSVVRSGKLFSHIALLPEFPQNVPFDGGPAVSLVPDGQLALKYIALRVTRNEREIILAFELFTLLNEAIVSNDDEAVVSPIGQIVQRFGHSLTLARKAAVVVGYSPKETHAYRTCVELVSAYGINGKNYGMMATIDSIAAEFNYLDLKFRFRKFASLDKNALLTRKISFLCFDPLAASATEAAAIISASYDICLLDAAFAMLSHRDQGLISVDVPHELDSAWKKLSHMPVNAISYFSQGDPSADHYTFRAAPAFSEYESFRRLRLALQPLYDLPESRTGSNPAALGYAADFFSGIRTVLNLIPSGEVAIDVLPDRFHCSTAGTLSRSCALVWVCDRDPDFSGASKAAMALLMGGTFELDRLIATGVLRRAAATANDQFVQLVIQTLLRAHSSATRDSYNFKDQFQKYIRQHHDGDILHFMEEVRSLSENIVHYFIDLLDETMLSQMAFLMDSSDAIYETRARLLEWFADVTNDGISRGKARQLRLDRKIAAVRGAINETRLNIDSVRFRQWVEQNRLSDFSEFIRQSSPNFPAIGDLTDASKASTRFLAAHREPTTRALLAIIECYEEFCRSPDFGIASFLGRRIRHGTLRGTLLNGLPDVASVEFSATVLAQHRSFTEEFSSSINALAGRLYFRDKNTHKDGLLSAEIDANQQWEVCLVCLNSIFEQAQQDHGILVVPLLIEQYCWLIFESELAKVQTSIGEARLKWGTLKIRNHHGEEAVAAFEKRVNIAVSDQFSTVISWFRKPPNISPVAELAHVIEVVVQEAKDEYVSYNPSVQLLGERDLQLSGATYYVAYDALTIAVRNAAKHGSHPGDLRICASILDAGSGKILDIQVESSLKSDDSPAAALLRIEEAGIEGPANADVIEGLSGIRKLQKMQIERRIVSFQTRVSATPQDGISVSFVLPFKGIVE